MSANAGAIFAGIGQDLVTGTVRSGPYGTTLPPTDQSFFEAVLNSGLKDAGYVGEAGVTIQQGRTFTDIKDMDGNVVETIQSESNGSIATEFLELNEWTLKNIFGAANVTVTASTLTAGTRFAIAVALGEDLEPQSHVFRMKSGQKRAGLVVPKGRFTEVGDIAFTSSGAASIAVTIKAIPVYDSALQKNVDFYLILDDGSYAISLIPVITSALPSGEAQNGIVTIRGSRFTGVTGATGVKFGGVNAADYNVIDDGVIAATVPAGSAGSAPITVTNASGTSAAFAYTRGA